MAGEDFEAVYRELRTRMLRAASGMVVAQDGPGGLTLHAPWPHPAKPKAPMWFGGVEIRKNYVSYHLMPVYGSSALRARIGPALKKRMQGKACFNFKTVDVEVFDALEALTAAGARAFAKPIGLKSD